ncbi:hypothetical protein HMPREF9148_01442 [Prevotella sp. F0091]|nr:hypothetical protein HMPREF9148_01442 [Prevotella sp. F0091]
MFRVLVLFIVIPKNFNLLSLHDYCIRLAVLLQRLCSITARMQQCFCSTIAK